jgi:hypothetical protein
MYNGEVNAINSLTFKANFLHQWTKMMNILASETFRDMTVQFLKAKAKKGDRWWNSKENARMESELNRLGIDVKEGVEWVNRGMSQQDPFYEGQFRVGATNFIHESVMTSRPSVRPMWHSIPHLAPIAHLKGFPSMFGNVVMKRWYHDTVGQFRDSNYYNGTRNTAYMMGTGAAMLFIADVAYDIKDHLKYGDELPPIRKNETEVDRLMRLSESAGFFGGWSTPLAGLKAKQEWGGNSVTAMLGPTISIGGDLMDSFGTALNGSGTRPLARSLARAVPVANVNKEVQKEVVDSIEDVLNDVFPLTSKKRKRRARSERRGR